MLHHDSFPSALPATSVPEARTTTREKVHVLVPEDVTIARPKGTMEQICVPASINGRDLSSGRP